MGWRGGAQQNPSDRQRRLLAPSLTWANEKTSLTLLAHYQEDDVDASILSVFPASAVFSNPNGRISSDFRSGDPSFERWDREIWSVGYLFSHAFNDALTVRQNLRFTRNELDSRWLFRSSLDADFRTLQRRTLSAREHADNLTLDNHLEWIFETGAARHTLLAGIDYQRLSHDTLRGFGVAGVPSIDLFAPVYHQTIPEPTIFQNRDVLERQVGIYMQDQIKIGSFLLLAGGRYDDARSSSRDLLNPGSASVKQHDHAFTGRLGAIYNFANGLAPYVSYTESFEPVSGTTFDGKAFKPMTGRQYEAGIKFQAPGSRNLVTLAVFDLTQRNMVTSDPDHLGESIQTGEVRTRGIEFEGKAGFDNGLDLAASYTYLEDEVTESNGTDLGKRRPQIPAHSASVWANYTVRSGTLSGLGLGVGVRRAGKTQGDSVNSFSVPGYTLVDLALHYDLSSSPLALKGWKADVNVRNLLDKYYLASCFSSQSCYLGVSRSVQVALKYNW